VFELLFARQTQIVEACSQT